MSRSSTNTNQLMGSPNLAIVWNALSKSDSDKLVQRLKRQYEIDEDNHWIRKTVSTAASIRKIRFSLVRVLWIIEKGSILPENIVLKRICDNKKCVSLSHHLCVTLRDKEPWNE